MATYANLGHLEEGLGQNGGTTAGSLNTTALGVDLIVAVVSWYYGIQPTLALLTDSASNVYTALTARIDGTGNNKHQMFYKQAPTTSTTHKWITITANTYNSIAVLVFSGSVASPFDQENGSGGNTGTPRTAGSITPVEDNCLVVTGFGFDGSTGVSVASMDGSYTVAYNPGNYDGVGIGYKIQTTAGAINPSWAWTGGANTNTASVASFKSSTGGGGGGGPVMPIFDYTYRQQRQRQMTIERTWSKRGHIYVPGYVAKAA